MIEELLAALRTEVGLGRADALLAEDLLRTVRPIEPEEVFPQHNPTFSRAGRFFTPKQDLLASAATMASFNLDETPSPKHKQVFSKSKRFSEPKKDQKLQLTVSYQLVQKRTPSVTIRKPSELSLSVSTALSKASTSVVGPGSYQVGSLLEQGGPVFGGQKRFKEEKNEGGDTLIFPNVDAVKPAIHGTVMRPELSPNQKLVAKRKQEQSQERAKQLLRLSEPADNKQFQKSDSAPRLVKPYTVQVLEREGSVQRKAFILHTIKKTEEARAGFDSQLRGEMKGAPCAALYKPQSHVPRVELTREPGPGDYDLETRPDTTGGLINPEGKTKQPSADLRDYRPDYGAVLPQAKGAIILPEHRQKQGLRGLEQLRLGPGSYDVDFKQVDPEQGTIRYFPVTQQNDRSAQMGEKKELFDPILFPKYSLVEPGVMGFVIKEPLVVGPPHIPESVINRENWQFYDANLDAVKENLKTGGKFAIPQAQHLAAEELRQATAEFIARSIPVPDVGKYDPSFSLLQTTIGNSISGKEDRFKEIKVGEGDVLLLDPFKPQPAKGVLKFELMEGRQDKELDPERIVMGDVLLLQPEGPKPQVPGFRIDLQLGRPQSKGREQREELILEPVLPGRHVAGVDMDRQSGRPQARTQQREQLVLTLNGPPRIPRPPKKKKK